MILVSKFSRNNNVIKPYKIIRIFIYRVFFYLRYLTFNNYQLLIDSHPEKILKNLKVVIQTTKLLKNVDFIANTGFIYGFLWVLLAVLTELFKLRHCLKSDKGIQFQAESREKTLYIVKPELPCNAYFQRLNSMNFEGTVFLIIIK